MWPRPARQLSHPRALPPPYALNLRTPSLSTSLSTVDPRAATYIDALRSAGAPDRAFAEAGATMAFVDADAEDAGAGLPLTYDVAAIDSYWGSRPVSVLKRVIQVVSTAGGYAARVAFEGATGRLSAPGAARARAAELKRLLVELGPAYVKAGQALSLRPDILKPEAMRELQTLCDKVPEFDDALAMRVIESELGAPPSRLFKTMTPTPIAAASLGQVYKATLADGSVVAVKVQRPGVLQTITCDLFIVRWVGVFLRRFPSLRTDVVALLDEWGASILGELNYNGEAANAAEFKARLHPILPDIIVPQAYPELTSRRVLTCEWVDGEKLAESGADDVKDLVQLGVVCYLAQLLICGFFHADPHAGNMIRTPDGRLAIIDFGLVARLGPRQRYGVLDAIVQLTKRDYRAILATFVELEFIDENEKDLERFLPALTRVFDAALGGGGAASINFNDLSSELAEITFQLPFKIPPFFALTIRAISVLEGIALMANPSFAIIQSSFPFVARMLLTDPEPRTRAALHYMLYGEAGVFDARALLELLEAFEKAVATTAAAARATEAAAVTAGSLTLAQQPRSGGARDALKFLLAPEGEFFREYMLEEVVKSIDGLSRRQLASLVTRLGLNNAALPALIGRSVRWIPLAPTLTPTDQAAVDNIVVVFDFLAGERNAGGAALARDLAPLLPAVAREVVPSLLGKLTSRVMARALRELFLEKGVEEKAVVAL